MKIRVIDFETTGVPEDQVKGVCEIGWTDLSDDWRMNGPHAMFVNPGHPIPAVTRAIHHICDADVANAVSPDVAFRHLMAGMEPGDAFAAHNAKFERAFFGGGAFPWICTLQCARHLFPEAPGHSNQVLRYHLDIDSDGMDFDAAMPPHRAGPDTLVTAYILHRLIFASSVQRLIELTSEPVVLRNVTFGKHRGAKWAALPHDYLQWVAFKSDLGPDEKHTARHILGAN
ncbi:exonuclease domain-containing protein [Mesorhizobium sp. YIM 152430]|uniref:exonuclease domain-containing protein n=1 Tax=Mesorhizobium sp. YIM 152430 TaxID=3031761 RepID=UPI0023DB6789|nr:exonuclease domain-containing protein [Mesorhizobium sp. YIM 152430]MDF1599676.1 exonuclease domain-containing protein [Mesorhizobium sp. YIM 152430]